MFKDTLLTRDETPTPPETSTSSWEVDLPSCYNNPTQAKELYHDARSWVAELRGRTEPPAYPLRTLMNVVNVADLIRDKHPWRARRLEDKLKRLARHPERLSRDTPRSLGRVILAINRFYHPKTGAAPAEAVMKQLISKTCRYEMTSYSNSYLKVGLSNVH